MKKESAFLSFFFSRLLLSVIIANYASFVLLNITKAPVSLTPVVYFFFLAMVFWKSRQIKPKRTTIVPDKISYFFIGITLLLLTLPRIPYLFDWMPGNTTLATSDDRGRILEVLAMVANSHYPLLSPSNIAYPFSFYYSSLYPFAVLKLVFQFLTIKECLFIGNFFYHLLILMSLYEISCLILRKTENVRAFIFCCTLFGGLDWIASGNLFAIGGTFEWWQSRFSGNTQISSFYTALYWTIHHFLAAYTVILTYCILFYTRFGRHRKMKPILGLILLMSAFYASPFAFISVPLFLLIHKSTIWKMLKSYLSIPVILSGLAVLPIFLNKFPSQSFVYSRFRLWVSPHFMLDKLLSLPVYIILVPLVEFFGIPLILFFLWKKLNKAQKHYLIAAWVFFLSTYVIAYSGANNYSMRGMLIPSFIFFFVFAQHWVSIKSYFRSILFFCWKPALCGIVLIGSIGTFKETAGRCKAAAKRSQCISRTLGMEEKDYFNAPVYRIAHNRHIQTISFKDTQILGQRDRYEFEKFITGLELENMARWERELLRKPYKTQGK